MIIFQFVLTIAMFVCFLSISDSTSEIHEAYKAINEIVQSPERRENDGDSKKVVTVKPQLDSLDKHVKEIHSLVTNPATTVEQKTEIVRLLIGHVAFIAKFLDGKNDVEPMMMKPVDFSRHSSNFTKEYVKVWAENRYKEACFYTLVAISSVFFCPDADLGKLKQFLDEKKLPQSLHRDLSMFLEGRFTEKRNWRLRHNGKPFVGHLKSINNDSVTIHTDDKPEETIEVNFSELSGGDVAFIYLIRPYFSVSTEIDTFEKIFAPDVTLEREGTRKLFLFNIPYKGFRIWQSTDQLFKTTAKFISLEKGEVTLEKADGKQTTIELFELRPEDQSYVKEQSKPKDQ